MEDNLSNDDLLKLKFVQYIQSICTALTWRGLKAKKYEAIEDGRAVYGWQHPLVTIYIYCAAPPFDFHQPNYLEVYINLNCDPDLSGVHTLNFQWNEIYGSVSDEGYNSELIPLKTLGSKNRIQISDVFGILDEFLLKKDM